LEKVLHDVEADVGCGAVDAAEEEDGYAHHGTGNDHCPFAADGGNAVSCGTDEDAYYAGEVDVDVGAVGVVE